MSELKITISQLEDLLDRQRQSICDHIINNVQPHSTITISDNISMDVFTEAQIIDATRKANYPHDFNILKRYVK